MQNEKRNRSRGALSGHKRIIETAAVLLAAVLVFSRGYAEQRFQKQMETLLEEYETMRILSENLLNSLSKASYAPFLVEKGVGYDLNFFVFVCSCISTPFQSRASPSIKWYLRTYSLSDNGE